RREPRGLGRDHPLRAAHPDRPPPRAADRLSPNRTWTFRPAQGSGGSVTSAGCSGTDFFFASWLVKTPIGVWMWVRWVSTRSSAGAHWAGRSCVIATQG